MPFCYVAECPNNSTVAVKKREAIGGDKKESSVTNWNPQRKCDWVAFRLPRNATPEVRSAWLRNVPEKKRLPFDPRRHYICERHFDREEIEWAEKIRMGNGEVVELPYLYPRLKGGVVPRWFGGRRLKGVTIKKIKKVDQEVSRKEEVIPEVWRDFWCACCFERWRVTGMVTGTGKEEMKKREGIFGRFLRGIGRFSGILEGGQGEEMERVFGRGCGAGGVEVTVCEDCGKQMEGILRLLEELELWRLRTVGEILEFTGKVAKNGIKAEMKELERKLGTGDWKEVKKCRKTLLKAGEQLKIPKVVLKPLKPVSYIPLQLIPPPSRIDNGTISGNRSILKLLGVKSKAGILECRRCEKFFCSEDELEGHQETYHCAWSAPTTQGTEMADTENPSQIAEDNLELDGSVMEMDVDGNDDGGNGSICLSTPVASPLPAEQICDDDDGDDEDNENANAINEKEDDPILERVPTLVLNENLMNPNSEMGTNSTEAPEESSPLFLPPPPPANPGTMDPKCGTLDIDKFPSDIRKTLGPASPIEPKQENDPEEVSTVPKKVPFMSSEYIGKYKILCKLKNLQTGKTCVGIVAKPTSSTTITQSSTTSSVPKVISLKPEKKPKLKLSNLPGPPFQCPLENCLESFMTLALCRKHYYIHKKKLKRLKLRQEREEARIKAALEMELALKSKPPKRTESRRGYPFMCDAPKCGFDFKYQATLDYHRKLYHAQHQCHFCQQEISSLLQLIQHEMDHTSNSTEEDVKLTCPRCNFNTEQTEQKPIFLKTHYLRLHLNIQRPLIVRSTLECEDCHRRFFTSEKYRSHKRNYHGQVVQLPFECNLCSKRFLKENGLRCHKLWNHSTKPNSGRREVLTCNICSGVYTRRRHYQNHLRMHQENRIDSQGNKIADLDKDKPFECKECGRMFSVEGYYLAHLEKHKGLTYSCPECGSVFQSRSQLALHRCRQNEDKKWENVLQICDLCGKGFKHLGNHRIKCLREIKGERRRVKEKNVVCDQCGKAFQTEGILKRHRNRFHPNEG